MAKEINNKQLTELSDEDLKQVNGGSYAPPTPGKTPTPVPPL